MADATSILEFRHYGLPRGKQRILGEIAVVKMVPQAQQGTIRCFVGPPDTDKRSLGRAIACSLGSGFVHITPGNVRDEAEIRGHQHTCTETLPERILQTMRCAGAAHRAFTLDEIAR